MQKLVLTSEVIPKSYNMTSQTYRTEGVYPLCIRFHARFDTHLHDNGELKALAIAPPLRQYHTHHNVPRKNALAVSDLSLELVDTLLSDSIGDSELDVCFFFVDPDSKIVGISLPPVK